MSEPTMRANSWGSSPSLQITSPALVGLTPYLCQAEEPYDHNGSAPIRLANAAGAAPLQDTAATPLARLDFVSAAVQGVRCAQARRKE